MQQQEHKQTICALCHEQTPDSPDFRMTVKGDNKRRGGLPVEVTLHTCPDCYFYVLDRRLKRNQEAIKK